MQREWLSEAGYRLVLQRRSTGYCFVWLFDRQGNALLAHEFEYYQQAQAEREAESLAGLGRMREANKLAAQSGQSSPLRGPPVLLGREMEPEHVRDRRAAA